MTGDGKSQSCCIPARNGDQKRVQFVTSRTGSLTNSEIVKIPGGKTQIGTQSPLISEDGEGPIRSVTVKPFLMAVAAVTNADFRQFVNSTGYVTDAERFGWSFVFAGQVPKHLGATQALPGVEWWRRVDGACWFAPNGPGSKGACAADHPVVQVSWADARAYAKWASGRLPTEAEWEHAARAGQGDVKFPWGDTEPDDTAFTPCNIWQGSFPDHNTGADGYQTTAPARSYEPNPWGLYNMVGNVWEWTADPFKVRSLKQSARKRASQMAGYKLSKGGSYLCHRSYCYRYRIAARTGTSPDSATTHQGFRVVWSV